MKPSDGLFTAPCGVRLVVLCIIAAILWLLLTGSAPAPASALCDQVARGGLIQTGEYPVTFDVIVNRQIVMRGVTAERILRECQ